MGDNLHIWGGRSQRAQVALEFMIVYSIVLIVFVIVFALIASQRSAALSEQESTFMQLIAQSVASYINQAAGAGNGYSVTEVLGAGAGTSYNVLISTTGLVIAQTVIGKQLVTGEAVSSVHNLIVNGTVVSSGNGITLYQIPTYTGSVTVSNARGTVFVDRAAPAVGSLPGSIILSAPTSVSAPYFTGTNSYIIAYNSPAFAKLNGGAYTAETWVYFNSLKAVDPFFSDGDGVHDFFNLRLIKSLGLHYEEFFLNGGNGAIGPNVLTTRTLYDMAGTCSSASNTVNLYLNGFLVGSGTGLTCTGSSYNVVMGGDFDTDAFTNGYLMDTQLYSTALSSSQIGLLAAGGPTDTPAANSLVGWWPLNGNANDYSGYGNSGSAYNTTFRNVVYINAQLYTQSGIPANSVPLGIETSSNLLGGSNALRGNTTTSGSFATLLTPQVGTLGNAIVQAEAFNGNMTTLPSLIGWWPLNLGSGFSGNVYEPDFSGASTNGTFISKSFVYTANKTNTMYSVFNGANSVVTTNAAVNTNAFTIALWENATNGVKATSSNGYTILNSVGSNNIQLWLNNGGGSGSAGGAGDEQLGIGSNVYQGYGVGGQVWNFVAVTVSNGAALFYLNSNSPYKTNVVATTYSLNSLALGQSANSVSVYQGGLSNLQIYTKALSPGQINKIYSAGLAGLPLPNSNITAWFPFSGSPSDYASYTGGGILPAASNNLVFNSIGYINPSAPLNATALPLFNGANSVVQFSGYALPNSQECNVTASAWVYDRGLSSLAGVFDFFHSGKDDVQIENNAIKFEIGNSLLTDSWTYNSGFSLKNNWVFVATQLNNGTVSGYLNGVPVGAPPSNIVNCPNIANALFGQISGSSTYMNGSIEDVQVYNTTLTPLQIQQLYVHGTPFLAQLNVSYG